MIKQLIYKVIPFVLVLILLAACGDSKITNLEELSLLQYGVPFSIYTPADAKVKKASLGVYDDITIKAGDAYSVQLLASEATELDAAKVADNLLSEVKKNPFFAELVQEDDHGFMYKKQIDSANVNYSFRYVRIQGDKEYIFQPSLVGQFTLDEVTTMYESVQ